MEFWSMTEKHFLKKSIGGIIGLVVVVCTFGYVYIANNVHDPFTIDAATYMAESAAPQFVGTTRQYTFRLINVRDKTLKLDSMQVQGYSGIHIEQLGINGKPVSGQLISSDRRGTSTQWVASGRHTVDYVVYIENKTIQNPRSVLIAYSYLGFKHTQTVNLPGALN
jgi:hypothetical protein